MSASETHLVVRRSSLHKMGSHGCRSFWGFHICLLTSILNLGFCFYVLILLCNLGLYPLIVPEFLLHHLAEAKVNTCMYFLPFFLRNKIKIKKIKIRQDKKKVGYWMWGSLVLYWIHISRFKAR